MLDPGCRSGRWISASPVVGPDDIQRRSLQILVRPTAIVRSTPLSSTSESRVPCASKWLRASVNAWPVSRGEHLDHRGREAGRGVDAGADGGAAQRQLADAGEDGLEPLGGVADGGGVPAELLAEHHRGGVHQVGAAGLHQSGELLGLGLQRRREHVERRAAGPRPRPASRRRGSTVGKVSLLDWLALTWSLGWTSTPARRASEASTSLVFMLELVPDPVWKTSIGKWSSCSPGRHRARRRRRSRRPARRDAPRGRR